MVKIARTRWSVVLFTALAAVAGIAFNQTTTSAPLVTLPDTPLYVNGSKAKANLTLVLSVESPTLGTAYPSTSEGDPNAFLPTRQYIGYHDHMVCYVNVTASDIPGGEYFTFSSAKATIDAPCPAGTAFDGNFLNWATTSAIDILRYGLTGGHRVFDEGTGAGRTVLERAYLPSGMYRSSFFLMKRLRMDQIALRTPFATSDFTDGLYIRNCRNRVYFSRTNDTTGSCAMPFFDATAQSPELVKTGNTSVGRFYQTRVMVCDTHTAANRLMAQNTQSQRWSGLCLPYRNASGGSFYKPVGQFQVNADNVRVSVFSYLNDDNYARYGGVMRAPLKYLGPRQFDANFDLMPQTNPHREWDPLTGVFIRNPQLGHADYGDQGYGQSGVISYINGFSSLNPDELGASKDYDPVGELYYEAFRYLQGQQPTPLAIAGLTGVQAIDRSLTENFPAYRVWNDPFAGFADNAGNSRSCLRNSVLTVADVFTHSDRYLPGNTLERYSDGVRPAEETPVPLDVQHWTGIVGSFEANLGVAYTDSTGAARNAFNIARNGPYRPDLPNIATDPFVETGATGSFLMAGLAHFANTQSFRADLPKARISTFAIDVNSYNMTGASASLRRGTQLHLAAKYGGFDDALTGNTGSPFAMGNNFAWQGTNGDAKNYFVVSDPQNFLDSIGNVFASLVNETSSIAGSALTSQELRSSDANSVYQGGFNPVGGDWSGRVRKFALSLSAQGEATMASTPLWEASELLTLRTLADNGASRNIVVGSPLGQQGNVPPSPFQWDSSLARAHQDALNTSPTEAIDNLGPGRLNFLRGNRRQERSASIPQHPFRARALVLGSVVNSGLVYQGAPSTTLAGTSYAAFQQTQQNRTPVVFANANDGMLHAFRASDGQELFAYIPGFIVPQLNILPDPGYTHRPLLDATPTVGEAQMSGQWRSVLVSGAGAGAQGIFALDVTEPDAFSRDSVLWEFTDADHPAMGNVLGKPRIVRVRMNDAGTGGNRYKWMAVVPGGVNNHRSDAYTNASASPSIFLIDLEARPSPSTPWREGANFWRIELPPGNEATAPGVIQITSIQSHASGVLEAIVAGDLHGNVWKLSFSQKGVDSLGPDGLINLSTLNAMGANQNPLFIARSADGARQPITSPPVVATGFGGKKLIVVGTGKFLESTDNRAPVSPAASVYVLLDGTGTIGDRTQLQGSSMDSQGMVSASSFTFGTAIGQKRGWYIDFPSTVGERQVSEMALDRGRLVFTTLIPVGGSCGNGGGRVFEVNLLTGSGTYRDSTVGLLGGPMLLNLGQPVVSESSTAGRRTATYNIGVMTAGANGVDSGSDTPSLQLTLQVGRMSWRQVHNHRDLRP